MHLIVLYNHAGKPISDFAIEDEYEQVRFLLKLYNSTIVREYSTENIISRLRVGVAEKDIWPFSVVVNGERYEVNEYGVMDEFPEQLSLQAKFSVRILKAGLARKKAAGCT